MQKREIGKIKTNKDKSYSDILDLPKKKILGVGVTNDTKENILEFIINSVKKNTKPYYIVTPNPEMLVLSAKKNDFKTALNNAKLALNDGVGVGLAAKIMGNSLKERFTGVELVEKLCEKASDWPITVGFLGGRPNIAEKASECLRKRYPRLRVAFTGEEWGKSANGKWQMANEQEDTHQNHMPYAISDARPRIDILFVAYGAPKQELWMAEHVGKINVQVMAGVGGAFDYISGNVFRAPKLVRSFGFEWLFRLIVQPWRWKRQLALFEFVWMVIREKVRLYK